MEMANTKKKPDYGDRMHNGNGRSDRYKKIGFLGKFVLILDFLKNPENSAAERWNS